MRDSKCNERADYLQEILRAPFSHQITCGSTGHRELIEQEIRT